MKKNLAMKRFSVLMVTIIMVTALCPTALAAEVLGGGAIPGSSLTWSLSDSGVLTISGSGAIPNFTANNLTGTGYNQPWADYESYITSIVVESGVTAVGNYAFYKMSSATSATLPDGVKTIGNDAFCGCDALTQVTVPAGVKTIGDYAFYSCDALKKVALPEGLESIGDSAFEYCYALAEIDLPEGLESIGNDAFADCDALTKIELPSTLKAIGNSAFESCDALTAIAIPEGVWDIGASAFGNCDKLAQVTLAEGVETIGSNAFSNCPSLTGITIPRSVWYIDDNAFHNCSKLADIRFEGAAPEIVNTAFSGVTANAQYPQNYSTWSLAKQRNYGGKLNWTPYTAEQSEPALRAGGAVPGSDLNWTLAHDGTLTISGTGAMPDYTSAASAPWFRYERIIKKLVVEQGVTTIGDFALGKIRCNIAVLASGSVYVYDAHYNALISISLPEGLTTIGSNAFYACGALASVSFPEGLTTIGSNAFSCCVALREIRFEGAAPSIIEDDSFLHVTATAYYPEGDETWTESVRQNYRGNLTWVPYTPESGGESGETEDPKDPGTSADPGRYLIVIDEKALTGRAGNELLIGETLCTGLEGADYSADMTVTEDMLWSIRAENGVYTISQGDKYLNAVYQPKQDESSTIISALKLDETQDTWTLTEDSNWLKSTNTERYLHYSNGTGDASQIELFTLRQNGMPVELIAYKPTASEKTLTEIKITKAPTKTEYAEGEAFDRTGMVVTATYSNGQTAVVTGYTVDNGENLKLDQESVTISYTEANINKTAKQAITVIEKTLTEIKITKAPDKTEYAEGEAFDPTGMVVTATYSNGTTEEVTGYTIADSNELTLEQRELTISYTEGEITVSAVQAITILPQLAGTNMTLGNNLSINFIIDTDKLSGEGHYAVITKEYEDKDSLTKNIPRSEWKVYSGTKYYFSFDEVAAKEMTDRLIVNVYDADGNKVVKERIDSVRDYAMRALTNEEAKDAPDKEKLALYVDMLNYGAAAQTYFSNYHGDDLANSQLTDEQKAYATATVPTENIREMGTAYVGTTLTLESEIVLNFLYTTKEIETISRAVATYTDHYGNEKTITIESSDFKKYDDTRTYIPVSGMAVADCSQPVTLKLYTAGLPSTLGVASSTTIDSVESYVARTANADALYTNIMKFAASAYAMFH